MSGTELFALLDRAQRGDDEACQQVLVENVGLIWAIVKRYYGCGVEVDDLYQLGCIGFIKAVKGFDLTYGTQFSTYAVPKIAGEIRRFLRDDGAIKVGRSVREKGQMLWSARERMRQQLGRDPHVSELAQETGLSVEEIASIELAVGAPESLQQETAEGLTLESTLGTECPEENLVEKIALREAIDALPERERMTILLRFFKGLTQEQTARILQVSQVQVSRLERRGLAQLREKLADETGENR
ncbi:MAG: sigma-70 family RNA polymerase sigma factor [Ruminococcaceae bacterium]|nr:sigma-70 family RNA polymerase sigma factor [Oscillospiraceae bacterium]